MTLGSLSSKLLLIATLAMSAAAVAAPVDLSSLDGLAASVGRGQARINGESFEIAALSGFSTPEELIEALRARFRGQLTVTVVPSELGPLVFIADLRSRQCPKCKTPRPDELAGIMEDGLALSIFSVPGMGPIAYASPAGRLISAAGRAAPLHYEGDALTSLASELRVESQSSFQFGHSAVTTALAEVDGPVGVFETKAAAAIEAQGYRPFTASAADGALASSTTSSRLRSWQRGGRIVSIQSTAGAPGQPSKVMIHEVATN
jgi:hypothetical protein